VSLIDNGLVIDLVKSFLRFQSPHMVLLLGELIIDQEGLETGIFATCELSQPTGMVIPFAAATCDHLGQSICIEGCFMPVVESAVQSLLYVMVLNIWRNI
jgi:hypothetical protein